MLIIWLWAFACLGVIWVLYGLFQLTKRFTRQSGCLELYVTNGESFIEGVIRTLAPSVKSNRVSMIVYCVDCTDQTVDIVSRLHLRDSWFSFQVFSAIPAENSVEHLEPQASDASEVCRVRLIAGQDPKEAIRFVHKWLEKM